VINENITFDYPVSVDVFKSVDDSSLYMPLSMLSLTSTPVENGEGSVFCDLSIQKESIAHSIW